MMMGCFFFFVVVVGAVKDVSFLIDVLPAYLFPNDERFIGECVLAGFSLGGHATWLALRHGTHTHTHSHTHMMLNVVFKIYGF